MYSRLYFQKARQKNGRNSAHRAPIPFKLGLSESSIRWLAKMVPFPPKRLELVVLDKLFQIIT